MTAPTLTPTLGREAPEAKPRFAHNRALAQQLLARRAGRRNIASGMSCGATA